MKKLIGSISVALTLALSVFGLAACDLVNFNWGTGSDHEHHFTVHEATDPTCAKNGNVLYYKCDVGPNPCGRYYIDLAAMEPVSEESVMIPALGHEYDFDNIVWSEWNGKEITASVTCTQCDEEEPGHVLNPKITVEFTQTKAPTCTAKGEGYYTASFTYEGETYTNPTTNAAEVDMIPHTYNKVPDDGWKWADGHTSVSATFTCTAADCTHTETVTVSGAAITSKVETIKGVCTDGSQTVYTATAEFNGETYDLTDTVVTRAAINEHKVGDWQYDATQHWHKCSVCGEDMDDKASHQPDSSTHKCECGYEEESYTVTAASINAADGKVVLTINGTCTGYTQETLAAAFKTFGFWGGSWTYPASEDFTLTLTEKAWTITVDVTKMTSGTYTVCLNDGGKGEFTVTDGMLGENATASTEKQTYTLQPNWENKLELVIAVEKTYAITAASIAAEGEAVYVTVSGTFAGYSAEEFLAALQDDKIGENELAFCVFYDGTGPSDSKWGRVIPYNSELIEYDAKEGGTFTVKINVTSLEKNKYKIGKDNADYADIKNLSCTGTATVGDKKYDLAGDTGGLALVVSDKPDESKARDLTGISLTAEGGRVYLVYTGTFKGYSEGEMTTYLTDEEIFYFWGNGGALGQKPASRAATFENGKWTLKLDVTDMPDDTEYALCWKDYTGNDLKPPLAGGSDTVQDAGNRTYTLIAQAWNGTVRLKIRTNVSFTVTKGEIAIEGGKTVVTISGTYSNCTKAQFEAVLKDTDETNVGFRVINGGNIIGGEKNWNKVAGPTSYVVGDDNTFTVKIDVTDLAAGKIDDLTAGNYYVNQQATTDTDIKSLTEKYEKSVTNGTKTYKLTGTPGANIALRVTEAPAKTAEFDIANLILFGGNQARVHIAIKSYTGFTEADLAKENVKLYVGEGEAIEPNEASVSSSRADYYFLVTGSSTGTLKLKIGDVELTNIASGVADVNTAFVNPNFYTLALNGDDLVLTVINAAEAFTLNGISLKNTEGTVNLTLTGTTTAADATAQLFLENYGYCYYKNGRQQFANKTVTVEGGAFTFTVNVTDLGAGSYTLLARDADGTDLKNGELVTDREVQIENMKYSITTDGTVVLVIEDSAHACDYTSITLEKTAEDKVYLVLGGTYDGYSKEEVEALLKNTNPGENYSLGFYPNVIPAEDRTITVNDSEKTWTLKFEITDLNAGAHNFCIQMVGGGDAKGPAGFVQQTETVGDTTFTLQGGVGANISVKVEKKDPDAQTGTVAYTSVTLEPTAEKVYLVYRGTYTGFTAEYLKETVLKNTDTSKEDIPSFGFWHEGAFDDATPAEITVTEVGLTWEVKIDVTGFSGEYSVLWRNIGGGDAKGPADFVAQSEAFNGNTYSLTGSVGGNIQLKVEEGIHGTYEVTSGSVELEGGKAYFSVNGTYKTYDEDGLKAALATVEFWFTRYGDWPEIGQGTSEKRTPFTTAPEISVDTEAKTWKVSVDVTNFENGTWIAKFPGDIKLAGSKDGQSVTVGDKTYSIFNKYPDGSEQPFIWGCTCLLVEDVLKENEINFGGESVSIAHSGYMFYWNGDTEGTNATVTTKTAVDGVYTFQYTLTETAKGNAGLWYAVQLFYKNSELKENTVYTLTFQLKSSVTGKITVNGTVIDLTGSNQVQAVSVEYTQNAKASLSIQFGVYGNAPLEGGTFVISELKWQEKTSGPEEPPAEKSATFAGSGMNNNNGKLRFFLNVKPSGYSADEITGNENLYVTINGQKYYPTEGTLAVDTNVPIFFDIDISELQAGQYPVQLYLGGKTYDRPSSDCLGSVEIGNKSFAFSDVEGKLTLTVTAKGGEEPEEPELKLTKAYSATFETNDGKLTVYIQGSGIADENAAKDTFTLLVGEREIAIANVSDVTKGDVYFILRFDFTSLNLDVNVYNNVVIKYGEETQAIDSVTSTLTWTDSANEKTYTIAIVDGNLQLTVAAVAPAADGSQVAPFSVSDLAAIFEGDGFNEEGYYTKDGEAQEVYVKGMVKSYDAASKQVTLQQIETRGGCSQLHFLPRN